MWGLETLKIEFNRSYLGFFFSANSLCDLVVVN